jgi:hypothetical protein
VKAAAAAVANKIAAAMDAAGNGGKIVLPLASQRWPEAGA